MGLWGKGRACQWDIGSRPPVGRYAPNMRRGKGNFTDKEIEEIEETATATVKVATAPNNRGNSNNRGNDKKSSANREKVALIDVNNAVKKLKKDDSVEEVVLKPTNSFYRRLQHKHAISQGFESISRGEGNDRGGCEARAKD